MNKVSEVYSCAFYESITTTASSDLMIRAAANGHAPAELQATLGEAEGYHALMMDLAQIAGANMVTAASLIPVEWRVNALAGVR